MRVCLAYGCGQTDFDISLKSYVTFDAEEMLCRTTAEGTASVLFVH